MENFNIQNELKTIEQGLIQLSDQLWGLAETRFEEYQSAALLTGYLEAEGFAVEENLAGLPTAFKATFGSGQPVIGILAEYDALFSLSQEADVSERKVIGGNENVNGNGHGCGHHLFGAASVGGAVLVKRYLESTGSAGTVVLFGCPGEEGGSGKAYMARSGVFDGLDVALAWHPASVNLVMSAGMLANHQIYYQFKGKSSHAAASPHLGRSALDAVELMNVGVNYLREHIIQEARVHYAVTNSGGMSPNVVQPNAESLYLIRAPHIKDVKEINARIDNIARGAALMTETEVTIQFDKACSNVVPNLALEKVIHGAMMACGAPAFGPEDHDYANKFCATLDAQALNKDVFMLTLEQNREVREVIKSLEGKSLCDAVLPHAPSDRIVPGSSDVGDVSWNVPTAQFAVCCYALGTPAHSWQMVAQGKSSVAHKGMLKAAEIFAAASIKLIHDPEAIGQAKEEFKSRLDGDVYECPIPPEIQPRRKGN
jgi:aminobenzoyl-glutamate utilization protein B